ncbi:MAG: hypothetical protein LBC02_10405 [Planctomycetaceae bacterium]|jgi:hypothetical protein|nr:hypothetical protein [Planctomycetaceae bacterium]
MTVYQDEFITFELPPMLTGKKVKRIRASWWIQTRKISLHIEICYCDVSLYLCKKKILSTRGYISTDGIVHQCDGPHKMTINEHETDYYIITRKVRGKPEVSHQLYDFEIAIEDYVLFVGIVPFDQSYTFQIEDYIPFLSSIKVYNLENLKQKFDEIEPQKEIKLPTFPVNIPPDFTEIPPYAVPGGKTIIPYARAMKKDGFEILIIDDTVLGLEADIDMFKEDQKDGIINERAKLFELQGKKCLVENTKDSNLDISRCQNISILLAFRGKCYSVSMKSDNPFDLNDYKTFLDSIGVKKKSNRKQG